MVTWFTTEWISFIGMRFKCHQKRSWLKLYLWGEEKSLLCMTEGTGALYSQLYLSLKVTSQLHSRAWWWLVPPIHSQQEQLALCLLVNQHRACLVILLLKSFNRVSPGHSLISAEFCLEFWIHQQDCLYFWEFAWPVCCCQLSTLAINNAICDFGKHNMFPKVLMVKVISKI